MANRTSCSAGKTTLIDPNAFDGQSSSSNIPVQHEDLTIYVELTTNKKSRTILTSSSDSNSNTVQSSGGVTVNFIEGSDFGDGKKYLSTKFTELTTAFESGNEQENLGITNIDIDFNSSFAPMITIQFVDVRGSAIFQNEYNVSTNKNKYSVLFQLPYPLYKLKIKGYYGQMVEYCLHMVKFNSKFNSKSGNFEITAQFVGYTYAMLSDMIIGLLKAISNTKYGAERYAELKKIDPNLMTLNELYLAISLINGEVKRVLQTSNDLRILNSNDENRTYLESIRLEIKSLGTLIDINKGLEKYDYYLIDLTEYNSNNYQSNIDDSNNRIKENIGKYNTNRPNDQLNYDFFKTDIGNSITIDDIRNNDLDAYNYIIANNPNINGDKTVYLVKNIEKYKQIEQKINQLNEEDKQSRRNIGEELNKEIKAKLGFEPTVRNIFYVLTTSVEVFLYVIHRVSKEAGAIDNKTRYDELKQVFSKNIENITDISASNTATNYYPWPDYREDRGDDGYVNEYLGKYGVLKNPSNVDELRFIDDLLIAVIISSQQQQNIDLIISQLEDNWIPINSLDTRLSGVDTFPYKRLNATTPQELIAYILIRATTFLSATNRNLTDDEISSMAKLEAAALCRDFETKTLLDNLKTSYTKPDDYLKSSFNVNDRPINILVADGNNYKYNYYENISNKNYIPINKHILESSNNLLSDFNVKDDADSDGSIFLSNYILSNSLSRRDKDGAIYVEYYTVDEYNALVKNIKDPIGFFTSYPSISINYNDLKDNELNLQNAGFQVFNGSYRIQEYNGINWGTNDYAGLNYGYIFYGDVSQTKFNYGGNGLTEYFNPNNSYGADIFSKYTLKNENFSVITEPRGFLQSYKTNNDIKSYIAKYADNTNNTITYPTINFNVNDKVFSLFGSRLYYEQTNENVKALLFLHTFPWNGLINNNNSGIFDSNEIYNTFAYRGGFIFVPRLWAAFIGGLLWRSEQQTDPIRFFDTNQNPFGRSFIAPFDENEISSYPGTGAYISSANNTNTTSLSFSNYIQFIFGPNYKALDTTLVKLPQQVKEIFIKIFDDFVFGGSWENIKTKLEIFDGNGTQWCQKFTNLFLSGQPFNTQNNSCTFSRTIISQNYKNFNNYAVISPILDNKCGIDGNYKYNLFLTLLDNSEPVKTIISLMKEQLVLSNATYRIWSKDLINYSGSTYPFYVSKNNIDTYLNNFIFQINQTLKNTNSFSEKKQIEQNVFGTSDEDVIKLNLYKTCKNIYDKWIGDVTNSSNLDDGQSIIFQCGARSNVDNALAKKRLNSDNAEPRFIDNFRFVTRSFRDIGDEMAINPLPINEYLRSNPNSSFYDLATYLLSSNNFDFVPLPNFINYREPELLKSVFQPITVSDVLDGKNGNRCGPTFVCVYVGEKSKHLDFGNSNYPNDGFDVNCDNNGNILPNVPQDFTKDIEDFDDAVTFFKVSYGQQNQNIFKDITLDQSEFAETAESLKIIDDISNKQSETNRTLAGQNIYNVYSIRSYKAEVEMMGNAMIQPMMYFQLDNIPMFHGAYMITRVKHSISPNYMSTNFTGVRIRKADTKIVTSGDLYSSLLDSLDVLEQRPTGGSIPDKAYAPIIRTMYLENGATNSDLNQGYIRTAPIQLPSGIKNGVTDIPKNSILISEAIGPLKQMLTDWIAWMKSNGFQGSNGIYADLVSAFRTYEQQEYLYKTKPKGTAAEPGTSMHEWGIAIDLGFYKKNGERIAGYLQSGPPNTVQGFDFKINESLVWLLENSYTYGWILPYGLRDGKNVEEFWHFEYHGKSAACIYAKNPKTRNLNVTVNQPYKEIVKNPKDKNGNEAIYTNCDYLLIPKFGDGSPNTLIPSNPNIVITPPSREDIDFYTSILTGIGAQATPENLKFFYAWRKAEGGVAAWNPFNTTYRDVPFVSYSCDAAGKPYVKNYNNKNDGIKATVNTLKLSYYTKIVDGLKRNIGAENLSKIVDELTKWGTNYGINEVLAENSFVTPEIAKTITIQKKCANEK